MKIKVILTVFSALLVAAGAWADSDRYKHRYAIDPYELKKVQKLAHEVEDRARYVHRSAERYAHHGSYREEKALLALHELEDRAKHFHRQAERYRQNFNHTQGDFRELQRAFLRTSYAMHDAHAFAKIEREFDRLTDAMCDLEIYAEDLFGRSRHARYRNNGRSRGWVGARVDLPRFRVRWGWRN